MRNNQTRTKAAQDRPSPPVASPANLAYVVPTEFVELPSKGDFYPEDHPLYGQETIEIKFMTAKEEDILSSTALIKKGLVIDRFLKSLFVEDIDPTTLLIGDRNAIMIAARVSSYGSDYSAQVKCEGCYMTLDYMFDLGHTNLRQNCFDEDYLIKEEIVYNKEINTFEVILPVSGVTVGLKPMTGKTESKLVEKSQDNKQITSLMFNMIFSVNGNSDRKMISEFVSSLPAKDSRYIRKIYPELNPNIDLRQEFICENCLRTVDMEVPLTAEFFWPG